MFEGWSDVPSVGGAEGPELATSGFQMDKYFGAWWGHWHGVKGERFFHCFKGREKRILTTWVEHVDRVITLIGKTTPDVNGEGFR